MALGWHLFVKNNVIIFTFDDNRHFVYVNVLTYYDFGVTNGLSEQSVGVPCLPGGEKVTETVVRLDHRASKHETAQSVSFS